MKRVLFLCTENACRSQMAEAITNRLLSGKVEAHSAGTRPSAVNPFAVESLKEIGIDISGARSKHVDEFKGRNFDLVITLCSGAREACPFWPGQGKRIHFGLDDPARAKGTKEEILSSFNAVRDKIISELISLLKKELGVKGD